MVYLNALTYSLFYLLIYKDINGDYFINYEVVQMFQPVLIADVSLNNEITRTFKKSDKEAFFLIGTSSGKMSCHEGERFRLFEGNSSTGLLRYEDNCLPLSKTWISDSDTIFVDITNPSYQVWILATKQQDYGGCLDTRVNLFASSDEQFITSANFPKQYPTMIDCMWNITSLIKRNIILTMYYMDIEVGPAGQCVFDVININTGDKTEIFCGENNWTRIFRISSSFIIDFKSDFSGRGNGFLIGYRAYTDTITNKHANEL